MKPFILLTFSLLVLFSCKETKPPTAQQNFDYLSKWFIANEDSLDNEFEKIVTKTALCNTCDSNWGEMAYLEADSSKFMGRFTLETKKYCDSLKVTFFYKRNATPHSRILISTDYNRNFTTALDTILNSVPTSKYFTLQKYEQPDLRSDGFNFPSLKIDNKDLRISAESNNSLENLRVFIYTKNKNVKLDNDEEVFLKKQLFGEELLLKKIKNVEFIMTDTISSNLLTLNQVRNKLM